MADLAVVFHWPPREMDVMGPAELMVWHERAVERSGANRE
ncbi:GpE family phage tail protein [Luteibacter sp. NPDC031894]